MASKDEQQLPQSLIDPITYEPFTDPVIASDGHTYERNSIQDWFEQCRQQGLPLTSPLTREAMDDTLQDNIIVRQIITELRRASERVESRSDEHTSELQSLMRISYAVSC